MNAHIGEHFDDLYLSRRFVFKSGFNRHIDTLVVSTFDKCRRSLCRFNFFGVNRGKSQRSSNPYASFKRDFPKWFESASDETLVLIGLV